MSNIIKNKSYHTTLNYIVALKSSYSPSPSGSSGRPLREGSVLSCLPFWSRLIFCFFLAPHLHFVMLAHPEEDVMDLQSVAIA